MSELFALQLCIIGAFLICFGILTWGLRTNNG